MTQRWTHYDRLAAHLAPAAALLVERGGVDPGTVIDIGTGSGNGLRAAAAADLAIDAIGLDLSPDQLEAAGAVGAPLVRGDAAALPFRSGGVDGAMSNFGIIFAPDHGRTLTEVARILRPGGRFAFTAWEPDGWPEPARQALAGRLGRRLPPFPTALGHPERAHAVLEEAGLRPVETEHLSLRWHFDDLDDAVDGLTEAAGGLRVLRRAIENQHGWDSARADLRAVIEPHGEAGADGLAIVDRYVLFVAEATTP
ncbi:MAG: methyltransferase domain-containing protein [Actinomycetota bacterium]